MSAYTETLALLKAHLETVVDKVIDTVIDISTEEKFRQIVTDGGSGSYIRTVFLKRTSAVGTSISGVDGSAVVTGRKHSYKIELLVAYDDEDLDSTKIANELWESIFASFLDRTAQDGFLAAGYSIHPPDAENITEASYANITFNSIQGTIEVNEMRYAI